MGFAIVLVEDVELQRVLAERAVDARVAVPAGVRAYVLAEKDSERRELLEWFYGKPD